MVEQIRYLEIKNPFPRPFGKEDIKPFVEDNLIELNRRKGCFIPVSLIPKRLQPSQRALEAMDQGDWTPALIVLMETNNQLVTMLHQHLNEIGDRLDDPDTRDLLIEWPERLHIRYNLALTELALKVCSEAEIRQAAKHFTNQKRVQSNHFDKVKYLFGVPDSTRGQVRVLKELHPEVLINLVGLHLATGRPR